MKYLKKFNEDLDYQTYYNASGKLSKKYDDKHVGISLNVEDRLRELNSMGRKRHIDKIIEDYNKNVKTFSKYGEYKCCFRYDMDAYFSFNPKLIKDKDSIQLHVEIFLIPKNVDDLNRLISDGSIFISKFNGGLIYVGQLVIDVDNYGKECNIFFSSTNVPNNMWLKGRKSANDFKKRLIDIFSEDSNFPHNSNNDETFHEFFEKSIIQSEDLEIDEGISSDFIKKHISNLTYEFFIKFF